jgi:hypothetical protein
MPKGIREVPKYYKATRYVIYTYIYITVMLFSNGLMPCEQDASYSELLWMGEVGLESR